MNATTATTGDPDAPQAPNRPTDPRTRPDPPRLRMPAREVIANMRQTHVGPERIHRAGGPVCTRKLPGLPPVVWVATPRGARDVLGRTDGGMDKVGPIWSEISRIGDNLFTLPNAGWKPRRRTLQPLFTKGHVEGYGGHMTHLAARRAASWRSESTVDLNEEMRHLTLDVIGRSMFGIELGDDAAALSAAIPGALGYVIGRGVAPLRLPYALPTPARRRFDRDRATIHAVIDRAMNAHDAAPESSDADLIRLFHETADPETGKSLSREALRDELFVFLVAGHDTTATTLTHALWQLGRHPDIQDAVRAEVAALGDRELTVSDSRALPLTVQVLHEAMRLAPPAAALSRWATRDCVVDGYRVNAGTYVIVSVYSLHRDPMLWEDPLEFRPQRFAPEHARVRDGWQYLPFGRGPRNCIGSHFAMLEATLGLATIIRAVDVTSVLDTFEVEAPFTLAAKGPVPALVRQLGGS